MPRSRDWVTLILASLLGLAVRLYFGRTSLTGGGIILDGYDEFYHMRRIIYTISHFPHTLWFDSYLDYPFGSNITWPPLFDQICAGLCLLAGVRDQSGMEMVTSLAVPFIGIMTIAVVYLLTRHALGSDAAMVASLAAAIAPYHVARTKFAATDHHGLEIFLLLAAILFLSISYSTSSFPVADRGWRGWISGDGRWVWSIAAGFALAALAYTWMGTPAYLTIFPLYAFIHALSDIRAGRPVWDGNLMVVLALACILVLPFRGEAWMKDSFLFLSILFLTGVVFYGFMAAREGRTRLYLAALAGFLLLALLITGMGLPWIKHMIDVLTYGADYLLGGGMIGRIAEAEPLYVGIDYFSSFGLFMLLPALGLMILLFRICNDLRMVRPAPEMMMLVLAWSVVTLVLTMGQKRFLYLHAINAAILLAILYTYLLTLLNRGFNWIEGRLRGIPVGETVPLLARIFLIALLLFPSMVELSYQREDVPPLAGDWNEALTWLRLHSPETSYFDRPDEKPEYGTMSLWDYGNWILYVARRPPVANNFQLGVVDSSRFLTSALENESCEIMDRRGCRYVVTDTDMVYGKFPAICLWQNIDPGIYQEWELQGGYYRIFLKPSMANLTLVRLHLLDGSYMGRFRLIHESPGQAENVSRVKVFEYVKGAEISGRTDSANPVWITLNLITNTGRHFVYQNVGYPRDGNFSILVPYATTVSKGEQVRPLSSYTVFTKGKSTTLEVEEDTVTAGGRISLDLIDDNPIDHLIGEHLANESSPLYSTRAGWATRE